MALGTATVGSQSETLTLNGVDTNATGYRGDLAPRTLTLTDTVVAPAQAVVSEAAGVNVGNVRVDHGVVTGGAPTATLTLSNAAAASDASLDATVSGSGAVTGHGTVKMLAGGATDATRTSWSASTLRRTACAPARSRSTFSPTSAAAAPWALPGQTVTVSGTVYNAASGAITAPTGSDRPRRRHPLHRARRGQPRPG